MSKYQHKKKRNVDGIGSSFFGLLERGVERLFEKIFRPKATFAVFPRGELTRLWQGMEAMEPRLAIIEADKLVDTVLKKAGVEGESFADRLRKVEKLIDRNIYNGMWEAHKARNELVHEINHSVDVSNAHTLLSKMKNFLTALGAFKND